MDRAKKESMGTELHETFDANNLLVLTHQVGLSVVEVSELRQQMREAGASFKVTKNRLAKIALKGTKFEGLTDQFTGPTAVAVSEDPVAAAKVVVNYSKENDKLTVLCGALGEDLGDGLGKREPPAQLARQRLRERRCRLFKTPIDKMDETWD